MTDLRRADALAEHLLALHWDGQPPVNTVSIARAAGLDVVFADAGEPGAREVIVPTDGPLSRQLYTAAAGLGGHLADEQGLNRADREVFARQFARALLLPGSSVRELRGYGARVAVLAEMFYVTPALVRQRLDDWW